MSPIVPLGFDLLEFAAPDPAELADLFTRLGFAPAGRHRHRRMELWRQGAVTLVLNAEPDGFGADFVACHGPGVCGFALAVDDSAEAGRRAALLGAPPPPRSPDLPLPALDGVGGAALYLVDAAGRRALADGFAPVAEPLPGIGLAAIDHLTHNVRRGRMDPWAEFYARVFGFGEIRSFAIAGRHTSLRSRAMASPDGKVRIPVNESADDRSQIEEFLRLYRGEGIQHIAFACTDIYAAVESLRDRGVPLLDTPDTYYQRVPDRLPGLLEDLERLRRTGILVDGGEAQGGGLLLQIFTEPVIGPIFFEFIQRKGNSGFGEGNFQALFEAVERDQVRRGVLPP
jgi:4-hydroxyphenylpyruvate dioxygenase